MDLPLKRPHHTQAIQIASVFTGITKGLDCPIHGRAAVGTTEPASAASTASRADSTARLCRVGDASCGHLCRINPSTTHARFRLYCTSPVRSPFSASPRAYRFRPPRQFGCHQLLFLSCCCICTSRRCLCRRHAPLRLAVHIVGRVASPPLGCSAAVLVALHRAAGFGECAA